MSDDEENVRRPSKVITSPSRTGRSRAAAAIAAAAAAGNDTSAEVIALSNELAAGRHSPLLLQEAAEAAAPAQAAQAAQEEQQQFLETLYGEFWHCDVKKDHPHGYSKAIVDSITPTPIHALSQPTCKETLLNRVFGEGNNLYQFFQNSTLASDFPQESTGHSNVTVCGLYNYTYKVYPVSQFKEPGIVGDINTFIGEPCVKITDTTNHISDIHAKWTGGLHGLYQAATRETAMDPAAKMSPTTIGGSNLFYYENDTNPTEVEYPAYSYDTKLSHFFCKYPITLVVSKFGKEKLTVHLKYSKGNKEFIRFGKKVTADINSYLSDAVRKSKGLPPISEYSLSEKDKAEFDTLEADCITKAFGDVGQVVAQFRPISLTNYQNTASTVSTNGTPVIFESYDVNALLKAFAVGSDYIWFHTSNVENKALVRKNLIIFKKVKDEATYQEERYAALWKKATALFNEINASIKSIQIQKTAEKAKLQIFRDYVRGYDWEGIGGSDVEKYKKYLELLVAFVTLENQAAKMDTLLDTTEESIKAHIEKAQAGFSKLYSNLSSAASAASDENMKTRIDNIEYLIKQLTPLARLPKDIAWRSRLMWGNNHTKVSMNELRIYKFRDAQATTILYDYDNPLNSITLDIPATSQRAAASKTISSWGIDIIYTYHQVNPTLVEEILVNMHDSLSQGNKDKFLDLLELVGILVVIPVKVGGRYQSKTLKQKKYTNKTLRKVQRGGAIDMIPEIENHVNFLTWIVYAGRINEDEEPHSSSAAAAMPEENTNDTLEYLVNVLAQAEADGYGKAAWAVLEEVSKLGVSIPFTTEGEVTTLIGTFAGNKNTHEEIYQELITSALEIPAPASSVPDSQPQWYAPGESLISGDPGVSASMSQGFTVPEEEESQEEQATTEEYPSCNEFNTNVDTIGTYITILTRNAEEDKNKLILWKIENLLQFDRCIHTDTIQQLRIPLSNKIQLLLTMQLCNVFIQQLLPEKMETLLTSLKRLVATKLQSRLVAQEGEQTEGNKQTPPESPRGSGGESAFVGLTTPKGQMRQQAQAAPGSGSGTVANSTQPSPAKGVEPSSMESSPARPMQGHKGGSKKRKSNKCKKSRKSRNSLFSKTSKRKSI